MLFNSQEFLLVFISLMLVLYFALPAFIGPTSQRLVGHWLRPRPIYAAGVACALFYLALKAGDGDYSEFIYFQF